MTKERVTRDDVRSIEIGHTAVFTLPTAKAVVSAQVTFSTLKRLEGLVFERVRIDEPLTVAYKRIK